MVVKFNMGGDIVYSYDEIKENTTTFINYFKDKILELINELPKLFKTFLIDGQHPDKIDDAVVRFINNNNSFITLQCKLNTNEIVEIKITHKTITVWTNTYYEPTDAKVFANVDQLNEHINSLAGNIEKSNELITLKFISFILSNENKIYKIKQLS